MLKKLLLVGATLAFAFGVLVVSVFRTASVKYDFNPINPKDAHLLGESGSVIDYYLPYPGRVLPDNPLWTLKALRDKLWLLTNTVPTREAELNLLFADKRMAMAVLLFEKGNADLGLGTLTKAEKYLEQASRLTQENRSNGYDVTEFLFKLADASLKHYELIEYILKIAPEEARPTIIQSVHYSKDVYESARNTLLDEGLNPPENPFAW